MVIYVTFLKLDFYWLSVSGFPAEELRTGSSRRHHSSTRPRCPQTVKVTRILHGAAETHGTAYALYLG